MMKYIITYLLIFITYNVFSQNLYPFQNPEIALEERVSDLIGRLTVEEKIGLLRYDAQAIPRLGIPEYNWWNECLHGVARAGRATVFPQAIGMAATWDTDLMEKVGEVVSTEARAKYNLFSQRNQRGMYQGLTFWTPNVNIFRDPRWGRGQETYGEDPYLTSQIGKSYVMGLQGDDPNYLKVAAMAKHYAVHNGPEALRHEFDAQVSMKDLWETYLPAFETLVKDANVEGIMGAYNRTNGIPCSAHPYLIDEVLRKTWGFKGYFVSDCWAVKDFYDGHNVVETVEEAAAMALNNGCNLNCGDSYPHLMKSIEAGLTTEETVDMNLEELLPTLFKLGWFDAFGSGPYDDIKPEVIASEEHIALSKEVATKSMVLLKNKENILPLSKEDVSRIYVTGPLATHVEGLLGNYNGETDNAVTFYEGVVKKAGQDITVTYLKGAMLDEPNRNPIDWHSDKAGESDVTIAVLGISRLLEGEEGESIASRHKGDLVSTNLPQNQIDFLRTIREKAKKLVVVITGGSPVSSPEVYEMADAIIYAWYPGEQGGNALGDLLFGDAVPSGRLPMTFVNTVDDLPPYEDYALKGRTYRYMEKEPLFPFGFGLSYTTFEYSDLALSSSKVKRGKTVTATVKVTNTGEVDAEEVVQLYLKDLEASNDQPLYSLKGFQRVKLAAGEAKEISFTITPEMMKIINDEGAKVFEKGEFMVMVGGSSPATINQKLGVAAHVTQLFYLK